LVVPLSKAQFQWLQRLEAALSEVIKGVGGFDRQAWRAFSTDHRNEASRNFIDGGHALITLPVECTAAAAAAAAAGAAGGAGDAGLLLCLACALIFVLYPFCHPLLWISLIPLCVSVSGRQLATGDFISQALTLTEQQLAQVARVLGVGQSASGIRQRLNIFKGLGARMAFRLAHRLTSRDSGSKTCLSSPLLSVWHSLTAC